MQQWERLEGAIRDSDMINTIARSHNHHSLISIHVDCRVLRFPTLSACNIEKLREGQGTRLGEPVDKAKMYRYSSWGFAKEILFIQSSV